MSTLIKVPVQSRRLWIKKRITLNKAPLWPWWFFFGGRINRISTPMHHTYGSAKDDDYWPVTRSLVILN